MVIFGRSLLHFKRMRQESLLEKMPVSDGAIDTDEKLAKDEVND